jgi:hypothetical protein
MKSTKKQFSNARLMQYAGLATQLAISLLIAVFGGRWIDKKINMAIPLCVWLFPLMVIVVTIFKLIKDTSVKK